MANINLRNAILSGLVLAVFIILFTFGAMLLKFPGFLLLMSSVVLWYGYAALYRTTPKTPQDAETLKLGVRWGLAITGAFLVWALLPLSPETLIFPALTFLLVLPAAAGASEAIRSGYTLSGGRVGFWSGVIGGLLGFFVLAIGGYIQAALSGTGVFAFMAADEYLGAPPGSYRPCRLWSRVQSNCGNGRWMGGD